MNDRREVAREAEKAVRRVFDELGGFQLDVEHAPSVRGKFPDFIVQAISGESKIPLVIEAKSRITPQTARPVCEQVRCYATATDSIPVVFAPAISQRVARIVEQFGVVYVDRCRHLIESPEAFRNGLNGLHSSQSGLESEKLGGNTRF